MDGMRPVDHAEVHHKRDAGFWFNPPGWRGWILPSIFTGLLMVNAFVPGGWAVNLIGGAIVIVVVLITNEVLKRILRR